MTPPVFEPEQEIRFAVVMYGGVSLAVYMNGVAQELFRLVQATAPEEPWPRQMRDPGAERRVYFDDEADGPRALPGSGRVYRRLGQLLPVGAAADDPGTPAPVRTRFVVDIISATSAGGINGVLLAKAIANQEDFSRSQALWLEVADIEQLLRGAASWQGIPHAGREPESILNGYRLYWKARDAMREMAERREIPGDDFRPAYAEQLDLTVTATDLVGLQLPIRLRHDHSVNERVHRKVFRFEYGTKATTGEDHSDFEEETMLAFAARATSSFPLAFEPVKLDDVFSSAPGDDPPPWLSEYGTGAAHVYFADGGYLDNKPFSYATQALRRRRADVPVTRKLLYIEPHPAPDGPPAASPGRERPDVYENLADAMVNLPRFETIRQDVAAVAERNGVVARLRDIELIAEAMAGVSAQDEDPASRAYRSLRRVTVVDQLTEAAGALGRLNGADDRVGAVREALSAFAAGLPDEDLLRLDTAFQQRRLSFLQDRVNDLLRRDSRPAETAPGLGVDELPPSADLPRTRAKALRRLKYDLNGAFQGLRDVERAYLSRRPEAVVTGEQLDRLEAVRETAAAVGADAGAHVRAVRELLAKPMEEADTKVAEALGAPALDSSIRDQLTRCDERFEAFDRLVLPLAYPDLGEVNAVEIWRISPRDAPEIKPEDVEDPVDKLAGTQLRHFAAFLERDWRRNDLMWGRLDAAEAIMDAVLPGDEQEATRARLRVSAQAAILRESLPGQPLAEKLDAQLRLPPSDDADDALVAAFRARYTRPEPLGEARRRDLAGRGLSVTGQVLAEHASDHGIPRAPLLILARGGPAVVRVANGWGAVMRRVRGAVRPSRARRTD